MLTLSVQGCSLISGSFKSSSQLLFLPHFFKWNLSLSRASPVSWIFSPASSRPQSVWPPQHQEEKYQQDLIPLPHFATPPGRAPLGSVPSSLHSAPCPLSSLLQHLLCFSPHSLSFHLLSSSSLLLNFFRYFLLLLLGVGKSGRKMWKKVVLVFQEQVSTHP